MIKQSNNKLLYDLHCRGFSFIAGLTTLAAIKSGLNVVISLQGPLDEAFQPELSSMYPSSIRQSKRSLSDIRFLLKCSSLFPHLYFPKRVLLLQFDKKLSSVSLALFDKLLGRDRDMASLPMNIRNLKDYSRISDQFPLGDLMFEYQFDKNRATVQLLYQCLNQGAIISSQEDISAKCTYNFKPLNTELCVRHFELDYPYPNPIRIEMVDFNMLLNPTENGAYLQISPSTKIETKKLAEEITEVFERLKLSIPKQLYSWLGDMQFNKKQNCNRNELVVCDDSLKNIRNETSKVLRLVSKRLHKRIKLKSVFVDSLGNAIGSEIFRLLQNECDEKFDLAKQTGIDYKMFCRLFYRYRFNIEEMIDSAYEIMNQERDPQKIWQQVESDFLKKEQNRMNEVLNRKAFSN